MNTKTRIKLYFTLYWLTVPFNIAGWFSKNPLVFLIPNILFIAAAWAAYGLVVKLQGMLDEVEALENRAHDIQERVDEAFRLQQQNADLLRGLQRQAFLERESFAEQWKQKVQGQ